IDVMTRLDEQDPIGETIGGSRVGDLSRERFVDFVIAAPPRTDKREPRTDAGLYESPPRLREQIRSFVAREESDEQDDRLVFRPLKLAPESDALFCRRRPKSASVYAIRHESDAIGRQRRRAPARDQVRAHGHREIGRLERPRRQTSSLTDDGRIVLA